MASADTRTWLQRLMRSDALRPDAKNVGWALAEEAWNRGSVVTYVRTIARAVARSEHETRQHICDLAAAAHVVLDVAAVRLDEPVRLRLAFDGIPLAQRDAFAADARAANEEKVVLEDGSEVLAREQVLTIRRGRDVELRVVVEVQRPPVRTGLLEHGLLEDIDGEPRLAAVLEIATKRAARWVDQTEDWRVRRRFDLHVNELDRVTRALAAVSARAGRSRLKAGRDA